MDDIAAPLAPPSARPSVLLPCLGLALLSIVSVAWLWNGGNVDTETIALVTQYAADRPVLAKIFDPHANDFTQYQARELSYFFDYLDATAYRSVIARVDKSFFVPVTALAVPFLFAVAFAWGVRSMRVDPLTAILLFACFVSCFGFVATLGFFYRSGKPLLALTAFALLLALRRLDQNRASDAQAPQRHFSPAAIAAFFGAMAVGLLDRQGAFYVLGATGILAVHYFLTRRLADIAIGTGLAGIAVQVYNLWAGPWIIRRLNGYSPYFGFQDIPFGDAPRQIIPASRLLLENVAVVFGGFPLIALAAGVVFLVLLLRARRRREPAPAGSRRFLLYVALGGLAHIVMYALMIARHPFVYTWVDHRYWYYPFPLQALALFAAAVAIDHAGAAFGQQEKRALHLLLAAVLIGNVASLGHYRELMTGGPWFGPVYLQSERLKTHLRTGTEDPMLAPNYREFAAFARGAASPAPGP